MIKRVVMLVILCLGLSLMTACSASNEDTIESMVSGNYYLGVVDHGAITLRFNEDGSVQIVDSGMARDTDKRKSYYAVYEETGVSLTIKFGNEEYSGVILEEGSEIAIGEEQFRLVDPEGLEQKTLDAFD